MWIKHRGCQLACAWLPVSTAGAKVHNCANGRLVEAVVIMCVLVGLWWSCLLFNKLNSWSLGFAIEAYLHCPYLCL